jgi:hypothetical protein
VNVERLVREAIGGALRLRGRFEDHQRREI